MHVVFFRRDAERCFASTEYDSWGEMDFKNYLKTGYAKKTRYSQSSLFCSSLIKQQRTSSV